MSSKICGPILGCASSSIWRRGAVILLITGAGGCASPTDRDGGWAEPRPLGRDVPAFRPSSDEEQAPSSDVAELTGQLTLRQAIAAALIRSPRLATFGWEVRAREARILQADKLPNPILSGLVENLPGRTKDEAVTGGIQTTIQLGQLIELGGKRASRILVATRERDVAGWEYEIERIEVLSQVSRLFIELLSAQRRRDLLEEAVRLAEQSASAVSERVKAGKASPIEETKANVATSTARIRLQRSIGELDATRRILSSTWGSTTPRFEIAVGELDSLVEIPSLQQLSERLAQNPALASWAAEVSLREAEVELAESNAMPDVTIGGGFRHYSVTGAEDVETFLLGFSLPLPLFNRNQGTILERRHRLTASRDERRLAEVRIGTELVESYTSLSLARAEAVAIRDTVLPAAQEVFETVSEGYRLGRYGLLDVLDAQRALFEARSEYLRATTLFHRATVDVERLIGERLDSVQ